MDIVFVTDSFDNLDEPTSKIVESFANYLKNKGHSITLLTNDYFGNRIKYVSGFKVFGMSKRKGFIYKLRRKIYSFFLPRDMFPFKLLKRNALKSLSNIQPQMIVSFSGASWAPLVGTYLSKKKKIKYFAFYTDPFSSKITVLNHERRINKLIKIEKKWMEQAKKIIMPSNYLDDYSKRLSNYNDKYVCVELPSFFDDSTREMFTNHKVGNYFVYAGNIDSSIRDNTGLIAFANYLNDNNKDYTIKILTDNVIKSSMPTNVIVSKRLKEREYAECIFGSKAIMVIDNDIGIQIPSKVFEAISTGKSVVFFYKNKDSYALKLLEKYKNACLIDTNQINNYDFSNLIYIICNHKNVAKSIVDETCNNYLLNNIFNSFYSAILDTNNE